MDLDLSRKITQLPADMVSKLVENGMLSVENGNFQGVGDISAAALTVSAPCARDYEALLATLKMETDDKGQKLAGQQFSNALAKLVATNTNISAQQKAALDQIAQATEALEQAKAIYNSSCETLSILIKQLEELTKAMSVTQEERQAKLDEKARLEKQAAEARAKREKLEDALAEADRLVELATDALERKRAQEPEIPEEGGEPRPIDTSAEEAALADALAVQSEARLALGAAVQTERFANDAVAKVADEIADLDRTAIRQQSEKEALALQIAQAANVCQEAGGKILEASKQIAVATASLDATGRMVVVEAVRISAAAVQQIDGPNDPDREDGPTAVERIADEMIATIEERNDREIADLVAKLTDLSLHRAAPMLTTLDLPDHTLVI